MERSGEGKVAVCPPRRLRRVTHGKALRLLHELLVELGAHVAGQRIFLHQGVDSFLGHVKAAQRGLHQVLHGDVLREVVDVHLWAGDSVTIRVGEWDFP